LTGEFIVIGLDNKESMIYFITTSEGKSIFFKKSMEKMLKGVLTKEYRLA
jgi:hypothetical protein